MAETNIWQRMEFPARDLRLDVHWPGRGRKMLKPYCWTPTQPFMFGGRRFIALYPCAAWEALNFGWVAQQRWDGITLARE